MRLVPVLISPEKEENILVVAHQEETVACPIHRGGIGSDAAKELLVLKLLIAARRAVKEKGRASDWVSRGHTATAQSVDNLRVSFVYSD